MICIDRIEGEYPNTYSATTAEDGDVVDTVSLPDPEQLPDEFVVDWDRHFQKFKSAMSPLLLTRFGESAWDDILYTHEQSGFDAFADD